LPLDPLLDPLLAPLLDPPVAVDPLPLPLVALGALPALDFCGGPITAGTVAAGPEVEVW
jgi:hypothetical protein